MPLHVPPLQIARGIYSEVPPLSWGEPADAYIPHPEGGGGALETVWIGGRDSTNHLVGGGFQDSNGEPTYPAPRGVSVFDYLNQYLWVANGWQGDPYGLNQAANPTPFLGWTAFCACIPGNPPGYGSGYSSGYYVTGPGGGGAGQIVTPCCPSGLPAALYLGITSACDRRLDGNYPLTWESNTESWRSAPFTLGTAYQWVFVCHDVQNSVTTFYLTLLDLAHFTGGVEDTASWVASSFSCTPFDADGSGAPANGNITSLCGGNLSLTWSVTD